MGKEKVLYDVVREAVEWIVKKDMQDTMHNQGLGYDAVNVPGLHHITFKVNNGCAIFRIWFTDDGRGIKDVQCMGGSEMRGWFKQIFGNVFDIYHG